MRFFLFDLLLSRKVLTTHFLSPSVNVDHGEPDDRTMITGLHTVRDISCSKCKTTVGWTYVCGSAALFIPPSPTKNIPS